MEEPSERLRALVYQHIGESDAGAEAAEIVFSEIMGLIDAAVLEALPIIELQNEKLEKHLK